ncbi:DUF4065 domain-containing protein [Salinicoccus sp. ID82-1]|uniref:Panacea domain-containing protein n=1 Tax=Salinicoccus sp. ID82-1 TaxID=2820269 RepID=UPI001F3FB0F2|nr:type II toxin-antitoxin system antitoxin SocA domain-containing protein [Salinicoccus sp. ID82-1]MCG1009206.1 DUF4065 domain-containing protein [Salinicoccus sp. ID82-1]
MKELVDHILFVASVNRKSVTQLQLHKISYFALGYLLKIGEEEKARQLYKDEHFQAWSYGPVLPKTYERFNRFKSTPILDVGENSIQLSQIPNFNELIIKYIRRNIFELVKLSHSNYFWKENSNRVRRNLRPEYTFTDLKRDFRIE